jgi:hypothetical protein
MIRIFANIILCVGSLGVVAAGSRLIVDSFSPAAVAAPPITYVAPITDRCYHTAPLDCPYAKQVDERGKEVPTIPFATREKAERFGTPCPHCVKLP